MTTLDPFPDVEDAAMTLVQDLGNVGQVSDDELIDNLPFIRIGRIGGTDDLITDRPRITIDVFSATRAEARAISETIRQRLIYDPARIDSVIFDKTITLVGPQEIPWSPAVRRYSASYQVSVRR